MHEVVYIGSDEFSAAILEKLAESGKIAIKAVVTYPDSPKGRGHKLVPNPVKVVAQSKSFPVIEALDVASPELHRKLRSLNVDIAILVSFKILPKEFLAVFPKGIINLHPSLLPDLRGAAPVNWAIILGYERTGLSTFLLEEKVDAGRILLQREITIGPDETAGELYSKMVAPGAEMLIESVYGYLDGSIKPTPQTGEPTNRAPKIRRAHRLIRWSKPAFEVHNLIRGLSPKPGALCIFGGKTVKILRTKVITKSEKNEPGMVISSKNKLIVGCGEGSLEIIQIQPEGGKILSGEQFLRGYLKESIGAKFEEIHE